MMRIHFLFFCLLTSNFIFGQEIETPPLLRSFTLAYENDVLKAGLGAPTDYYYTGGTFLEFNLPCLEKSPVSKILLRLPQSYDESFGISLNSLGFTPTNTEADTIVTGDRPFAGTIYLGLNRVSCNPIKQWRLTSRIDVGAIGPVAGGYETQKFIHEQTNNAAPHGWQFQIENDLLLNYSLKLEKGITNKNIVDLIGYGAVNAGTIYSNASVGLKIRAGRMNHYFKAPGYSDRFQFWIYSAGECKVIAYDATLQGGLFNNSSVYTIAPNKIERAVFSMNAGVVLAYHKFRVEYFNTFLTREFETGKKHAWGHLGFQILF